MRGHRDERAGRVIVTRLRNIKRRTVSFSHCVVLQYSVAAESSRRTFVQKDVVCRNMIEKRRFIAIPPRRNVGTPLIRVYNNITRGRVTITRAHTYKQTHKHTHIRTPVNSQVAARAYAREAKLKSSARDDTARRTLFLQPRRVGGFGFPIQNRISGDGAALMIFSNA